jgi:hypothetical protein
MPKVTSLEPRTPHQPGKLQKMSKNEYVFTLLSFRVNKKHQTVSYLFAIECRPSTTECSGYCAASVVEAGRSSALGALSRASLRSCPPPVRGTDRRLIVKISAKIALEGAFPCFPRKGVLEKSYAAALAPV